MPAVQRTQSWRQSRMGDGAAVCGWHRQECLCYWKRNRNFLIGAFAIRNRRKPLKQGDMTISNRRRNGGLRNWRYE
jgi:hypothetical protein